MIYKKDKEVTEKKSQKPADIISEVLEQRPLSNNKKEQSEESVLGGTDMKMEEFFEEIQIDVKEIVKSVPKQQKESPKEEQEEDRSSQVTSIEFTIKEEQIEVYDEKRQTIIQADIAESCVSCITDQQAPKSSAEQEKDNTEYVSVLSTIRQFQETVFPDTQYLDNFHSQQSMEATKNISYRKNKKKDFSNGYNKGGYSKRQQNDKQILEDMF